jgi:predicted ABC-type sugar transport system permease subunit
MKLSVKSLMIAGALFKGLGFLFISVLNIIWRPYGGAYLAMMSSLYPYYDPVAVPASILLGTLYAVISGAVAGAVFGWLYNFFAE